jgi:hypothetical protein
MNQPSTERLSPSTIGQLQPASATQLLVAQGEQALLRLSQRTANHSQELIQLLSQARAGDGGPLQSWLAIHGPALDLPNTHTLLSSVTRVPQADWNENRRPGDIGGWEHYRQLAIGRLDQLSLSSVTHSHSSVKAPRDTTIKRSRKHSVYKALPASFEIIEDVDSVDDVVQPPATIQPTEPFALAASIQSDKTSDAKDRFDLQLSGIPTVQAHPKTRWMGIAFSATLHSLLITWLALLTMKTQDKQSFVGLEATEINSQSAELVTEDIQIQSAEIEAQQPEAGPQSPLQPTIDSQALSALDSVQPTISSASGISPLQSVAASRVTDSGKKMIAASRASFYGAEAEGNSFCFVIDGSGSMRGAPWQAAKTELLRSLSSLKDSQRFFVVFFNKKVYPILDPEGKQPATTPLYATEANVAHARRWLETLEISTGEPPQKAFDLALKVNCDAVYFLADGEMSESQATLLLEWLARVNRAEDILDGQVVLKPIHCISYYSEKGLATMKLIAQQNRGNFSFVPKPRK